MTYWKLILTYNGSAFHGWQVQPGLVTVQGTLAEALRRLTGEEILPQGAGRTDAGVHALGQVASFALEAPVPPANLLRALNRILRPEVRVLHAEEVGASFHARHSSRRKVYEYRVFERRVWQGDGLVSAERICSPFLAPYVWDCRWPVQMEPMEAAAGMLRGTRDFSAMAASGRADDRNTRPNPVKTVFSAGWRREQGLLMFRIEGSGFLHHMVRNLVGTMVDIGRGSLEPEDMERILASGDRSEAGPTAPASGLFLVRVGYEGDPDVADGVSLGDRTEAAGL